MVARMRRWHSGPEKNIKAVLVKINPRFPFLSSASLSLPFPSRARGSYIHILVSKRSRLVFSCHLKSYFPIHLLCSVEFRVCGKGIRRGNMTGAKSPFSRVSQRLCCLGPCREDPPKAEGSMLPF